ncbi:hypothetical protein AQI88_27425 [Streptomyces cellostaticus]|uniref:Uncharacterized protein n=1 Tax=Streptomyces cellostaticus TaxID=67285 RepID=A0A124HC45_9ACTN|nr:hypothetical protein [Streptomyces cellostaticus]KUM93273.1 hypothetical protein AQI88_27425 [Streptomyces cellostaticus]GHI09647.1 hypothetical protein Scel_79680 [Streptomyces cellostaticus]
MNARSIVRRAAVGAGTLAGVATLVLGGSGVASAETARYTVWSNRCSGTLMTQYVSGGGGWQVRNYVNNNSGGTTCSGWIDWAADGDTNHFYGLQNRIWVDPYHSQESTYIPDNDPALARVCVQANGDNYARCTAWW